MIDLKKFMEVIEYKVTEGNKYCWECFGPDAYAIESWNGDHNGHSFGIVFDTVTHTVYQVTAYDYRNNRAYRIINPDYKIGHDKEAVARDVDGNQAWDDVNYIDLETDEDFVDKATSIAAGIVDYDTRIQVPLDLSNDEMLMLMKLAHQSDLTLNEFVEELLLDFINQKKEKTPPAKMKAKKKKDKK